MSVAACESKPTAPAVEAAPAKTEAQGKLEAVVEAEVNPLRRRAGPTWRRSRYIAASQGTSAQGVDTEPPGLCESGCPGTVGMNSAVMRVQWANTSTSWAAPSLASKAANPGVLKISTCTEAGASSRKSWA